MTRAALILAVLAAVVAACAPSQQRLLAGRHYAEALRGVEAGEVDGAAVLAAIERDLQVGLHMQAVGAADLRAQLPAAPPQLDELALVRVSHDANVAPITSHELSLSLLHRQSLLPPIAADRATLAAIFGETLPQAVVTVTPGTRRYKSIGPLELLGRVVVNFVTIGLIHSEIPILPSEQVGGSVATTQPSDGDYRRASPISEHLFHWLQSPSCSPGLLCRYHVLWPRPRVGGEAPLELAVALTIDRDTAILYRFALPAGSLEGALTTMFGDRMRTLDELQRRYGRSRVAVHVLDVLEPREQGGFTPASRARLERLVLGTRRRPGLRTRPGLRFLVDPAAIYGVAPGPVVAELRIILLGLGLTDSQIEIRPDEPQGLGARLLRVQYDLPPRVP